MFEKYSSRISSSIFIVTKNFILIYVQCKQISRDFPEIKSIQESCSPKFRYCDSICVVIFLTSTTLSSSSCQGKNFSLS